MNNKKNKILIFVPGYNVSKTVGETIQNLMKVRKQLDFHILYVDNNSTDNSVEIVKKIIIKNHIKESTIIKNIKNLGYGGSQKVAFNYAMCNFFDYLIEYDADLQYSYEEIINLYKKIKSKEYSIVFGSRVTKEENIKEMPLLKAAGNKISNNLLNWAFDFKVSEIHTGFRIYNINLINKLNLNACQNDYRWSLDSVIEIKKVNSNFSEIPVKGYYHKNAKSPSLMRLIQYISYLFFRALRYKIFSD